MAIKYSLLLLLLLFALLNGCGILYTNVVEPYTTDFNNTPVGFKKCIIRIHKIREPITGYGISAEWDTKEISKAMQKAGMKEVYFADIQTLTLLLETYRMRTLILYGD